MKKEFCRVHEREETGAECKQQQEEIVEALTADLLTCQTLEEWLEWRDYYEWEFGVLRTME